MNRRIMQHLKRSGRARCQKQDWETDLPENNIFNHFAAPVRSISWDKVHQAARLASKEYAL